MHNWRALDIDQGFKSASTEDKWTHPGERTSGQVPPMSGEETYNGPGASRFWYTRFRTKNMIEVGVEVPRPGPRASGQGAPLSGG